MWMVNPRILCRKHLLGEHVELHMFLGCLKKGMNLEGYVKNNLLEFSSLRQRHDALVKEMEFRQYKHHSDLDFPTGYSFAQVDSVIGSQVDAEKSLKELLNRCEMCKRRHENDNLQRF
jgi:hypothetical protein